MIQFSEQNADAAIVGVGRVKDVTRHGIITPNGNRIINMVEKPDPESAPSNLGAVGMYVFENSIFDDIKETKPGYNGEFQLTDSLRGAIASGKRVFYGILDGVHIDVGTAKDLMMANEWYTLNVEYEQNGLDVVYSKRLQEYISTLQP